MSSPHLPSPSASIPPSSLAAARSSSQLQLLPASSSSSLSQQQAAAGDPSSSTSSFPPPPTPSSLSSDWSPLTGSTLSPPEAKDDSPPIDPADSLTRSQFITHDMVEEIRATQKAEHRGQQRRGGAEQRRQTASSPSSSSPSSSSLSSSGAAAPAVPAGSIAASASSPGTSPPAVSGPTASAGASPAVADSGSWQRALHHVIASQHVEAQPAERKEEASSSNSEDRAADERSSAAVVPACDGSSSLWSTVCSRLSSVGSFMSAHPAVPLSLLSLSLLSLGFFLGRRYQRKQQLQCGLLAPLDRIQRLQAAMEQAARGAEAAGGAVISSGAGWVKSVCGVAADRDIPGVIVTVKFL